MEQGVYGKIMEMVDKALQMYLKEGVSNFCVAISDLVYIALILYVLIWGAALLLNTVEEPLTDSIKRTLKIILIVGLAVEGGIYCGQIVDLITSAPEELSSLIMGKKTLAIDSLDKVFQDTWALGDLYWAEASIWENAGFIFVGLIIWGMSILMSIYTCYLILLSKIAITILVTLGPIFIISLLFEGTKRFFESWVGQICNYIMVHAGAIAVNFFVFSIYKNFYDTAMAKGAENVESSAPIIIVALISFLVLRQVPSIASAFSSGVALDSWGMGSKAANVGRSAAAWGANRKPVKMLTAQIGNAATAPLRYAGRGVKKIGRAALSAFTKR